MGKFFVLICLLTQVLTREVLVYFDRSELQFVWQETMTELRFVWPVNVTIQKSFRALTSWPSYLHKKYKKIGIYKMEKPITKKRYFNDKRENSQPNTSYTWHSKSDAHLNSVYPKKVNNNLQQISSFKKHHGKTRAKHL